MQVIGTVISTDTQSGVSKAGREWKKKTIVIEWAEESYFGPTTKHLAFDLFGESLIDANPVKKGQRVRVVYTVESKEFNGRWFTQCNATGIIKAEKNDVDGYVENPIPMSALTPLPNNTNDVSSTMTQLDDSTALPF